MVMEELLPQGRVDNGVVVGVDPHLKGMRAFTVREGEYPSHNRKRTRRFVGNNLQESLPGKISGKDFFSASSVEEKKITRPRRR
jgi:hypothetical protein